MKILNILITLVLCLCSLTACTYEKENEKEYDMSDEFDYNDGYDHGYDEGYSDGYDEAKSHYEDIIEWRAVHYAREYSEYHPEEAMSVIYAYESGDSIITEDDYKEAVQSLYSYYEFFYNEMYD